MSAERSVVWFAKVPKKPVEGDLPKAVIGDGGELTVVVQAWDRVDEPCALELYEAVGEGDDAGSDVVLGWIEGVVRRKARTGKSGAAEDLWLEPSGGGKAHALRPGPGEGEERATFKLKVPIAPRKHARVVVPIRGVANEGRFELGLRVRSAAPAGEVLDPPAGREVVAHLVRSLDDPAVLERFTPYTSQCAVDGKEEFATRFAPAKWNDVPRTPLGYYPTAGDYDQLGCGHLCLALALAHWGEFADPKAFVDAHLSSGVELNGAVIDPTPFKDRELGEVTIEENEALLATHPRWSKEAIAAIPHPGYRACLLWAWWFREHYQFPRVARKKALKNITLSGSILKNALPRFPSPEGSDGPARFEVVQVSSMNSIVALLREEPMVPVLVLLRRPAHWVLAVGYKNGRSGRELIVHDSGNMIFDASNGRSELKEKLAWEVRAAAPAGFDAWPKRLHAFPEDELVRKVEYEHDGATKVGGRLQAAYGIRCLAPPAGIPGHTR